MRLTVSADFYKKQSSVGNRISIGSPRSFIGLTSEVLVAVDLIIEMVENGLHCGGELHIEIEEIDREGHREKRETYKQQLFKELAEFRHFISFLLSTYHDSSSWRTSRLGSTGSSPMTVRI